MCQFPDAVVAFGMLQRIHQPHHKHSALEHHKPRSGVVAVWHHELLGGVFLALHESQSVPEVKFDTIEFPEVTLPTPKTVFISALPSGLWAHLGDSQDRARKAVASAEITSRMRDALDNFESRLCTAMQGLARGIVENLDTALSVVRATLEEPTSAVTALMLVAATQHHFYLCRSPKWMPWAGIVAM